jgi:hypothetical protein
MHFGTRVQSSAGLSTKELAESWIINLLKPKRLARGESIFQPLPIVGKKESLSEPLLHWLVT